MSTTLDFLTENSTTLNFTKFPTFSENFGKYIIEEGSTNFTMTNVNYVAIDVTHSLIIWCDKGSSQIKFLRYGNDFPEYTTLYFPKGIVYTPPMDSTMSITLFPVGIAIDEGLGKPRWGHYIDCYGNGICLDSDNSFVCNCNKGFSGDCQVRSCPKGRAWFHEPYADNMAHDVYMECSNIGVCDRLRGTCLCSEGFEGAACERMSCLKNPNTDEFCSNSGICRTMREMAIYHRDEYMSPQPVVYGSLPNNPATWDSETIMGCIADVYGYSDSGQTNIIAPVLDSTRSDKYSCPRGYNYKLKGNRTSTTFRETQSFVCSAQAGFFHMSFRGVTSQNISYDATVLEFKQALLNVPSIGAIQLSLSTGTSESDTICLHSGQRYLNITFLSVLGKLPLLQYQTYQFKKYDYIQVTRVIEASSYGLLECSGQGDCLTDSGTCNCWSGFTSSNGIAEFGYVDDCGYPPRS